MASIIVASGNQRGEYLPLGQRISVIGRAETLPLQILDERVSRRHFRIHFDKDSNKYYAEDMNSRHGTLVNMRRITQKTVLVEGDQILIGETNLLFTEKDFDTQESALMHWKQVGEKSKSTRME
ncbi:MAG: FHA domain-containing protein [Planctomycetota bacterium]|jgi:pSer/pThr/pTyr-binding forkhead associated (FHA) protein